MTIKQIVKAEIKKILWIKRKNYYCSTVNSLFNIKIAYICTSKIQYYKHYHGVSF